MGAIVVAVLPPIICLIFTKDVQLSKAQNAVENRSATSRNQQGEDE